MGIPASKCVTFIIEPIGSRLLLLDVDDRLGLGSHCEV